MQQQKDKILRAALEATSFTAKTLAASADVTIEYVHKLMKRHEGFFESAGEIRTTKRGRPAKRWRVRQDSLPEIESELGTSITRDLTHARGDLSAELLTAELALVEQFPEAVNTDERGEIIRSAVADLNLHNRLAGGVRSAQRSLVEALILLCMLEFSYEDFSRNFISAHFSGLLIKLQKIITKLPKPETERIVKRCMRSSILQELSDPKVTPWFFPRYVRRNPRFIICANARSALEPVARSLEAAMSSKLGKPFPLDMEVVADEQLPSLQMDNCGAVIVGCNSDDASVPDSVWTGLSRVEPRYALFLDVDYSGDTRNKAIERGVNYIPHASDLTGDYVLNANSGLGDAIAYRQRGIDEWIEKVDDQVALV